MLTQLESLEALAQWRYRHADRRIAFVPTMGNLHEGHLALIDRARAVGDVVIASIFVNPTQFGPNEDFDRYPRTLAADCAALSARGCDAVFLPDVDMLYPEGTEAGMLLRFPGLDDILCGASRPGHFEGVARVVAKLFHVVQPQLAVFGQKDYQQLAIIRRLVTQLSFPVQIVAGETVREADGLALSSRNQYLSPAERELAPQLAKALDGVVDRYAAVGADQAVAEMQQSISQHGFKVDYVALLDADDLGPERPETRRLVALAAAWLGATRLIDNKVFAKRLS